MATVLVIVILVLSVGIHEGAHAWVAYLCGDSTAKDMGRMTVDPIPSIDPFWSILMPAVLYIGTNGQFVFGGGKPVPVNPYQLRHPARDMMFVAIAGPISNFLIGVVLLLAWRIVVTEGGLPADSLASTVLFQGAFLNMILAAFNMLPLPPLDGSRVVAYLLRGPAREAYVSLERFGILIVMALLYFDVLNKVIFGAGIALLEAASFLTGGSLS